MFSGAGASENVNRALECWAEAGIIASNAADSCHRQAPLSKALAET